MNSAENILSLIPQRPPFIMIDELLYADEMLVRTAFQVNSKNVLVEDGKFSEAGIVENIAQTAAAHSCYFSKIKNEDVALGYIGAIKNLQIFSLPNINDKLITEVQIINQIFDVTIIEGEVFCDNKLIAECEMKIFVQTNIERG